MRLLSTLYWLVLTHFVRANGILVNDQCLHDFCQLRTSFGSFFKRERNLPGVVTLPVVR